MIQKLTHNTFIPISLAVTLIGGGAAFATRMESRTSHLEEKASKSNDNQEKLVQELQQIKIDIAEIKAILKRGE